MPNTNTTAPTTDVVSTVTPTPEAAPPTPAPETTLIADSFTSSSIKVNVTLKSTATHAQAMKAVETICTALDHHEASATHLRMLLGRVVAEVKARRLYEPEYAGFDQFVQAMTAKYHLSRMTIYKAQMIANNLPQLQPKDVEAIPLTNLELVAGAAKDAKPGLIRQMLKAAAKSNLVDFREQAEKKGWVVKRGRPEGGSGAEEGMVAVRIHMSVKLAALLKERAERAGMELGAYVAQLMGVTASGRAVRTVRRAVATATAA